MKQLYPQCRIVAAEALQCPTLLRNGFGGHRIEGIGDKHIPWIHNVKNTDFVVSVDDNDCMDILRLFNEEEGQDYLQKQGVDKEFIKNLDLIGISGIGNLLSAIKFAKYYELTEEDTVMTILTDSMELYSSRKMEMHEAEGHFSGVEAAKVLDRCLLGQKLDSLLELGYYDRMRIHNLKYFTWIEQQGRNLTELNDQWYKRDYWTSIQKLTPEIDGMIEAFNRETGLVP